jgi:hypothetical protein
MWIITRACKCARVSKRPVLPVRFYSSSAKQNRDRHQDRCKQTTNMERAATCICGGGVGWTGGRRGNYRMSQKFERRLTPIVGEHSTRSGWYSIRACRCKPLRMKALHHDCTMECGRLKGRTISCAIMPPMLMPITCNSRLPVQPRWSTSSTMSLAISEVEYRNLGLSESPMPRLSSTRDEYWSPLV